MALLNIRVQPRASRNEVGEMSANGTLKLRVTAPPTDSKANDAVIKLLAKHLHTAPSTLTIVRGGTSRNKVIEVEGMSETELRQSF